LEYRVWGRFCTGALVLSRSEGTKHECGNPQTNGDLHNNLILG
jgi:hypothetical protein